MVLLRKLKEVFRGKYKKLGQDLWYTGNAGPVLWNPCVVIRHHYEIMKNILCTTNVLINFGISVMLGKYELPQFCMVIKNIKVVQNHMHCIRKRVAFIVVYF